MDRINEIKTTSAKYSSPKSLRDHLIVQEHDLKEAQDKLKRFADKGYVECCGSVWGESKEAQVNVDVSVVVNDDLPKRKKSGQRKSSSSQNKSAKSGK